MEFAFMKKVLILMALLGSSLMAAEKTIYDFTVNSIDGQSTALSSFKGKVVLLVNVASRCGYTPQYTALESIYEKYEDRGLVVIGFPANNFGAQEPGTNQEIKTFCSAKYHVSFPMMAKVSVKGSDITPLYQFLTDKNLHPQSGGEIGWNFTKFLVGPDGKLIERFDSAIEPNSPQLTAAIEKELGSVKQ
jgi:glutathione peroxidase